MSTIDDWYYEKSFGEHFAHMFFAPTSLVNPFFYEGLYESTQDDTTLQYVVEHLAYLSPWLPASIVAGQSPFHIWSTGLQVMRYVAADAGVFRVAARASIPTMALVGVGQAMKSAQVHGTRSDRYARRNRQMYFS